LQVQVRPQLLELGQAVLVSIFWLSGCGSASDDLSRRSDIVIAHRVEGNRDHTATLSKINHLWHQGANVCAFVNAFSGDALRANDRYETVMAPQFPITLSARNENEQTDSSSCCGDVRLGFGDGVRR
jgi:hypothetical protein